MLYNCYTAILDDIAPFIHKKTDDWVTSELLTLIRQRDCLKEETDKCQDTITYQKKIKIFREKRNQTKRKVINAKRNFAFMKLNSNTDNPRKYWAELNRIMPTGKNESNKEKGINTLTNDQGDPIESEDTSTYINEFSYKYWSQLGKQNNTG